MASHNNVFSEFNLMVRDFLFGNDKMTSVFSFKGTLNRSLGWVTASVLWLILTIINDYTKIMTCITGPVIFYCTLALVQKRCRDYGSSGTFWIIYVSIIMILESAVYFLNPESIGPLYPKLKDTTGTLYFFTLIPQLIPGKPEPDLSLRSPLLKYPFLYTVICLGLAILIPVLVNIFYI